MNKKFSTLVAVILAAGAWTTLDAKVDVTSAAELAAGTGGDYVVGVDADDPTTYDVLLNTTNGQGEADVAIEETTGKWTLTQSGANFKLQAGGKCFVATNAGGSNDATLTFGIAEGDNVELEFTIESDGKLKLANVDVFTENSAITGELYLKLAAGAVPTLVAEGEASSFVFGTWSADDATDPDTGDDTATENENSVPFTVGAPFYLGLGADGYISTEGASEVATDNAGVFTAVKISGDKYRFVYGSENKSLVLNGAAEFIVEKIEGSNGFYLKQVVDAVTTADADETYLQEDLQSWGAIASAAIFNQVDEQEDIISTDLAAIEKDGFTVTIKYGNNKTDLTGNPFVGHLVVEDIDGTSFKLKSGENYIVGVENGIEGTAAYSNAYTFKTVSAKELADNADKYVAAFKATKSKFDEVIGNITLVLAADADTKIGYVTVGDLNVLAAHDEAQDVTFSIGSTTAVKPEELLTDKFFTVKNGDKVLGVLYDDTKAGTLYGEAAFVAKTNGDLEDQWALTLSEDGTKYIFTNRETKEITYEIAVSQLYHGEKEGEYVFGDATYAITPIEGTEAEDGYLRLENVKNKRFNLGYWSDTYNATAWFTENHKDVKENNHVIGLDQANDPLVLAVVDFVGAKDADKSILSDSIYVVSELGYFDAKGEYKEKLDTLKVVSYSFINQFNEPMKLATKVVDNKDAYVSAATPKYNSLAEAIEAVREGDVAQKFTLRKVGDKLNLRPVEFADAAAGALYHTFSVNDVNKMYSGDTKNGILYDTKMYERPENDRFVIEETDKPMYRTIVNPLDTISIYRQDNSADVMYEKGQFLGIANNVQFNKIAPAMVADLAYVDSEGHHPQYALLVNPGVVAGGTYCPEHGYNSGCPHAVPFDGYTTGRYLVNLKDTAIVWNTDNHMKGNPYVNSENYYKLGFVQASHIGDSLIFNAVEPTAADTIKMNTADYNVAKFSFRYVDNNEKSFVIETADYEKLDAAKEGEMKATYGYLKWMNDVVVVVDDIKDADVFNMNEDEDRNPTANEGVEAATVSVVATNGAVIVKGAAGKKVVISNVLGQTIANTVVSSDEATIAAPAGVVVVAVEGEAAVKAIVK